MTNTTDIRNKIIILLCTLALSVSTTVSAQLLQASLSHYSVENGLASNAISSITHDDYGFIWIATWNGISRFDGFNFYNYKTGNASGIKGLHNRVNYILIDQSQNAWLKMYDGRLFVINRQTDCIEDPLKDVNDHEDFRIDYFFTPFVNSSGDVLVSFEDVGLYKLRLDRSGLKHQHILTGSLNATCVVEGYHNDLWVGTNKGVHRIDMANLTLEKGGYFLDESITYMTSNGYNIYVGTKSGKIMQFSYGQEPTLVKDFGKEITGLFIDSHEEVDLVVGKVPHHLPESGIMHIDERLSRMCDHILVDIAYGTVIAYRSEMLGVPGVALAEIIDFLGHILLDDPAGTLEGGDYIIGKGFAVYCAEGYLLDIGPETAELVEDILHAVDAGA